MTCTSATASEERPSISPIRMNEGPENADIEMRQRGATIRLAESDKTWEIGRSRLTDPDSRSLMPLPALSTMVELMMGAFY